MTILHSYAFAFLSVFFSVWEGLQFELGRDSVVLRTVLRILVQLLLLIYDANNVFCRRCQEGEETKVWNADAMPANVWSPKMDKYASRVWPAFEFCTSFYAHVVRTSLSTALFFLMVKVSTRSPRGHEKSYRHYDGWLRKLGYCWRILIKQHCIEGINHRFVTL